MKIVRIIAVCVILSLIGFSLGLSQELTERIPTTIPEKLQAPVDLSNPLLQISDPCEWLGYPCNVSYFWRIPDTYGDDFFNMRFTPSEPGTLKEVYMYFYDNFPEFSDASGLGVDIIVWSDNGSGLPSTELARINVPAAQILYYPDSTSVDFSSENLVFSGDFHVGYTVVDQTQDTIATLSDDGSCGQLRSSEYWSGQWGLMDDDWGVDVNFLIYAQVCAAYSSVILDIKPQSCPNPFNTKAKGVLPVAILGTENFDVTTVDPSTILLQGVAPIQDRWRLQDVSRPVELKEDSCICTSDTADGYMDMTLKFSRQEILAMLQPVSDGEQRVLTLTGMTYAGTEIKGEDCLRIIHKGQSKLPVETPTGFSLDYNYPNPFNTLTEISFSLTVPSNVKLEIFNIKGQKVTTIIDGFLQAGEHKYQWDGSHVASGVYFYRLQARNFFQTKKMLLLK